VWLGNFFTGKSGYTDYPYPWSIYPSRPVPASTGRVGYTRGYGYTRRPLVYSLLLYNVYWARSWELTLLCVFYDRNTMTLIQKHDSKPMNCVIILIMKLLACLLVTGDSGTSCSMQQHIACVQPFVGEVSSVLLRTWYLLTYLLVYCLSIHSPGYSVSAIFSQGANCFRGHTHPDTR